MLDIHFLLNLLIPLSNLLKSVEITGVDAVLQEELITELDEVIELLVNYNNRNRFAIAADLIALLIRIIIKGQ